MSRFSPAQVDERSSGTSSYQVLHLLPSAPQELIVEVYHHLARQLQAAVRTNPSLRPNLDELREAYTNVVGPGASTQIEGLAHLPEASSQQRSPWALLHVDPDAPPDIVELACTFWYLHRRADGPSREGAWRSVLPRPWRAVAPMLLALVRRTAAAVSIGAGPLPAPSDGGAGESAEEFPAGAPEPTGRDANATRNLAGPAPHRSVEQRLAALAATRVGSARPQPVPLGGSSENATQASAQERNMRDGVAPPAAEPPTAAPGCSAVFAPTQPSRMAERPEALALLVAQSGSTLGMSAMIGRRPFRIGTDPTCDLVVTPTSKKGNRAEARIWLHEDRFLFHDMGAAPVFLVNGHVVAWAVLEDGDRLQVGNDVFRFERITGGAAASSSSATTPVSDRERPSSG